MNKKKLLLLSCLVITSLLITVGCSDNKQSPKSSVIKVGATAGPQAQILEAVKPVLAKDGVEMQIIEFNDFATPNTALNQGDLNANSFQHKPFLDAQISARKYDIMPIGKTVLLPMGIYSKKVKKLDELPENAKVAIPNDPSNGGRALLLLQKVGLIKLKENSGILPTLTDIVKNDKKLKIVEIEAAQTPRSLDDVDLVAINTNYALVAGLVPTKDALAIEDKDSPYACIIVAKTSDKDNHALKKLVKAYQSPQVEKFINDTFKGSIVKAW